MSVDVFNLRFSASSSTTLVLSWDDVAATYDIVYYRVQYRLSGTDSWSAYQSVTGTTFSHAVTANTSYDYRLTAWSSSGEAANDSGTLCSEGSARTYYPTSLNSSKTEEAISLTWASDGASFLLERSADSGVTWLTLSTSHFGTNFSDDSISRNVNYLYRVTPNEVTGVPRALTTAVGVWKFTTLTAEIAGNDVISLTFDNDPNFTGYRYLQYSVNQTSWYNVLQFNGTAITNTKHTSLIPGNTYYYRIFYAGSPYYVYAGPITLPNEITNPAAQTVGDGIALSWDAVSGATSYRVFRSPNQTTWRNMGVVSDISYYDSDIAAGTAYYYKITTSVNSVDYLSDIVTGIVLPAVENLAATRSVYNSNFRFTLTWNAVTVPSGYGTVYYTIQFRTADESDWTDVVTNNTNRSYLHTIAKDTWYYYRVRANGSPYWTEFGPIWFPDVSELAPSVTLDTQGQPVISWTEIDGATRYSVTRSTSINGTYVTINTPTAPASSYTDVSAAANTTYYYKVGFPDENLWSSYATQKTGTINYSPTDITLSQSTVSLPIIQNDTIGTLTATDPNSSETFTFSLVSGTGSDDNASFALSGSTLQAATKLTAGTFQIRLQVTDHGGLTYEKTLVITVSKTKLNPPTIQTTATGVDRIQATLGVVAEATGYEIQYSTSSSFTAYETFTTQNAGDFPFIDLNSGTTYYFRAKAFGDDDYADSDWSATSATMTLIPITTVTLDNKTPNYGDKMTATVTPTDATVTWEWFRNDNIILNETSAAHIVGPSDIGKAIKARATGTGSYTGTVESLPTATIFDNTPPTLTLSNSANLTVYLGESVTYPTATARDDVDGNLTPTRTITNSSGETVPEMTTDRVGTFIVTWTATDSSGNTATKSIHVDVRDNIPPVITLNDYGETGSANAVLSVGATYVEYGATAVDETDGAVTVIPSGTVDTQTPGIYEIIYSASDLSENSASAIRTIVVSSRDNPVITNLFSARTKTRIRLTWTALSPFPVTIQRKTLASDWADLETNILSSVYNDYSGENDTRYCYRLISDSGIVLSNETENYFSDTLPPSITLNDYGETGLTDAVLPIGVTYVEYGATVTDAIDSDVEVVISGEVDSETPGIYPLLYTATDDAGHSVTATRYVFVHGGDPIIHDFTATAISQFAVRLKWSGTNGMGVNLQRRQASEDSWTTLAQNVTDLVYDDSPPTLYVKYYYRLTKGDVNLVALTGDIAWLIRVTHFSVVIQPIASNETSSQTWTTVTDISQKIKIITEATFMTETIGRNESGVFCARVFDTNTNRLITQDEIESIRYSVYKVVSSLRSTVESRTAVTGHEDVAVDKNETILEEAIHDEYWTTDEIGYNFIHEPDTRTDSMFPEAGNYEVVYTIRLVSGNPIPITFNIVVS